MASDAVELLWHAGPIAVAWKVAGVPCRREEPKPLPTNKEKKGAKVGAKGGRTDNVGGGRSAQPSVVAWADRLLEGEWEPLVPCSDNVAGIVLLARPGAFPQATEPSASEVVRGTYALVVAPAVATQELMLAETGSPEVEAVWEPIDLFGGLDDESRVVTEGPSGHFGRLAIVELDVPLNGCGGMTLLDAVLALKDHGLLVVQLTGVRGSEMRNPQLVSQTAEQADVQPGTLAALVAVRPPLVANGSRSSLGDRTRGGGGLGGFGSGRRIVHEPPAKFTKLLKAEQALAEQRASRPDGVVMFHGITLHAPSEQLKPRPSSGAVVDCAIAALLHQPGDVSVLDLGVGCGALLLAILRSLGARASGTGVDIDDGAVKAFRSNVNRNFSPDHGRSITVVQADFAELDTVNVRPQLFPQGYHCIVCNPPYRSEAQQAAYDKATGPFGGHTEHAKTLVAGKTGLEMYEAIASCLTRDFRKTQGATGQNAIHPLLRQADGTLIFQVEAGGQGRAGGAACRVGAAVERASEGLLAVQSVYCDAQGLERAIVVRWKE